jgi:hypothetical protein
MACHLAWADLPFWVTQVCTYGFLLLLAAYDLLTTKKVHRITLWASAFLILVQQVRLPLGHTATWQAFATWTQVGSPCGIGELALVIGCRCEKLPAGVYYPT